MPCIVIPRKKIMLDKSRMEVLHPALVKALAAFAKEHGLTVAPIRLSWTAEGFKGTLQMGDKAETGDANPAFARMTAAYGRWYGLDVKDIGKKFKFNEVPVIFEGLKSKYVAIYRKAGGTRYRAPAADFARANKRVGIMSK